MARTELFGRCISTTAETERLNGQKVADLIERDVFGDICLFGHGLQRASQINLN